MDCGIEHGAKHSFEPWGDAKLAEETEEERLDRLECEEAETDTMEKLENRAVLEETNMAVEDALDEIRSRNAHIEHREREGNTGNPTFA